MISEFHSSYRCIEFTKNLFQMISLQTLKSIDGFIEQNQNFDQIRNFIKVLESETNEKQQNIKNFNYHEVCYGHEFHGSFKINKSLYLIDLYDITISYLSNPVIKSMLDRNYQSDNPEILKTFFDGSYFKNIAAKENSIKTIFMSIYADEINLINPIGNNML